MAAQHEHTKLPHFKSVKWQLVSSGYLNTSKEQIGGPVGPKELWAKCVCQTRLPAQRWEHLHYHCNQAVYKQNSESSQLLAFINYAQSKTKQNKTKLRLSDSHTKIHPFRSFRILTWDFLLEKSKNCHHLSVARS